MPTFDTPEPISVTVDLSVGDVRLVASERTDTVVEVRPTDQFNNTDAKAAEQTRVDYSGGRLQIRAPKQRGLFGKPGSVDISIELPGGSDVRAGAAVGAFRCEGPLGECRIKTSTGDIQLDQAGAINLNTAAGDVTVQHAVGHADVSTGSGAVRIRGIDGTAVIKNSNGDTAVGEITGDLRANAANGDISVERAHATVAAKTANGSVRIGEVRRGSVNLGTSIGELEIGIREGTAAWLDVNTQFGEVRNSLAAADSPAQSDETVEVRARSSFGDIVIHRS